MGLIVGEGISSFKFQASIGQKGFEVRIVSGPCLKSIGLAEFDA
jgi:hypothetical protein